MLGVGNNLAYIDLREDEVTVSVDEGTGKSLFIDRDDQISPYRGFRVRKQRQAPGLPFTVWARPHE